MSLILIAALLLLLFDQMCMDVCKHFETHANADVYADETMSNSIPNRRSVGYLRSHGSKGIGLACFALVHPDQYSEEKTAALLSGSAKSIVSIPLPTGSVKDEANVAESLKNATASKDQLDWDSVTSAKTQKMEDDDIMSVTRSRMGLD